MRYVIGAAVLMGAVLPTQQSPAPAGQPFILSNAGLIFVEASVNGTTVQALVDTGSFKSVQLSASLADRLHLATSESDTSAVRYEGGAQRTLTTRVDAFAVGPLRATALDAVVVPGDVERIASQVGTPFDAILGWAFTSRQPMTIDFAADQIHWDAPAPAGAPAFLWPYEVKNGVPLVHGAVREQPVLWLLDTGAPICNVDPAVLDGQVGDRVEVAAALAGQPVVVPARIKSLGPLRSSTGAGGVIGTNFLRTFVVRIDPASRTVALYRRTPTS
jgi:hypothetical protein